MLNEMNEVGVAPGVLEGARSATGVTTRVN